MFNCAVSAIDKTEDGWRLKAEDGDHFAESVIVCTGGKSYPSTGSTGDGYRFAARLGLQVEQPRPSLCGIECKADWLGQVQGLSLKNIRITAYEGEKSLASFFGEMLFTHFGVSGPTVFSLSALLNSRDLSKVTLKIDLKPALDDVVLDKRILRDLEQAKNKLMRNALEALLPKSLIMPVLETSQIPASLATNSLTRIQRDRLRKTLKGLPLHCVALRPIEEAVVTAGGIMTKQIDPKTMQCRTQKGVYFCGETLDLDAFTGGFNLQIAFTTGYLAGCAAAR